MRWHMGQHSRQHLKVSVDSFFFDHLSTGSLLSLVADNLQLKPPAHIHHGQI